MININVYNYIKFIPELCKIMSGLVNGPGRFLAGPEINSLLNKGWTKGTQIKSYLKSRVGAQI